MVADIIPCSRARTTFITPAMPLDDSVWPRFILICRASASINIILHERLTYNPTSSLSSFLPEEKDLPMAAISSGSPTGVLVPQHSI